MAKKKATEKPAACNCLNLANEELAKQNLRLTTLLSVDFQTKDISLEGPFLSVEWKDPKKKSGKLPHLSCSYCPMCGKKK